MFEKITIIILFTNPLNSLFLRNKTKLTFVNGPMVYNVLKAFFIAPQFRKSINLPHESLEIKLRFWTFAHAHSSISIEELEIISELNTSNFHKMLRWLPIAVVEITNWGARMPQYVRLGGGDYS